MRPRTAKIQTRHLALLARQQRLRDPDRLLVANILACEARPRAASRVRTEPLLCIRPVTAPRMQDACRETRGGGASARLKLSSPVAVSTRSFSAATRAMVQVRRSGAVFSSPSVGDQVYPASQKGLSPRTDGRSRPCLSVAARFVQPMCPKGEHDSSNQCVRQGNGSRGGAQPEQSTGCASLIAFLLSWP